MFKKISILLYLVFWNTLLIANNVHVDEIYRTSTNSNSIEIISENEVEMRAGKNIIIGSYTIKRGRLRIVYTQLGTKYVEYFDFIKEGLVDKDDIIYFSSKAYKDMKEKEEKEKEKQRKIEEQKRKLQEQKEKERRAKRERKKQEYRFCKSAAKGDIETLKKMLDGGVDINASCNALTRAVNDKQFNTIKFLIKHGIDINQDNGAALSYFSSYYNINIDMVQILLDNGADPNANPLLLYNVVYGNRKESTALAKLLYKFGARFDIDNKYGVNALDLTIEKNNLELFKLFINDENITEEVKSRAFSTLVHTYNGVFDSKQYKNQIKQKMFDIFLQKNTNSCQAINTAIYDFRTSLFQPIQAAEDSLEKYINKLLPYCNDIKGELVMSHTDDGATAKKVNLFFTAVYASTPSYRVMKILLEKGVDINFKDELGWTPLHQAIASGYKELKLIEFLLKNGADINAETNKGLKPLDLTGSEKVKTFVKNFIKNSKNSKSHQKLNPINKQKNITENKSDNDNSVDKSYDQDIEKYSLQIDVIPNDAKIDITNIKDFFHQNMKLKKGIYYLQVTKQGYKIYKTSFKLIKDTVLNIVLEKENSNEQYISPLSNKPKLNSNRLETIESDVANITVSYPRTTSSGSAISLDFNMINLVGSCKGGLSISFPQFKNSKFIQDMSHNGFYSLESYNEGSKIYSTKYKNNILSKYVLVEGWSKQWEVSSEKNINLIIVPSENLSYLTVDVRGVLICNGQENILPTWGIEGQQGYYNKRIKIDILKDNRINITNRHISDDELQNKSAWQLRIMRNEIYARHGYIFKTAEMKNYFQQQSWYEPKFDNVDHLLTDIDKKNISKIQQYEQQFKF